MTDVSRANDLANEERQLEGGFLGLLVLLVGLFILAPVVNEQTAGRVVVDLLFFAALVAAIYVSIRDRRTVLLALLMAAIAWAGIAAADVFDVAEVGIPAKFAAVALLAVAPVTVLSRVLRDERVTLNTIYGAVCVYFLLSFFWAVVYSLIEDLNPGSFAAPISIEDRISDFVYFSMVTQTTLGYGDITPVSGLSRSLSALEAVLGQIFLVVTVARLVALQVADSSRVREDGRNDAPSQGNSDRGQPAGGGAE